MIETNSKRPSGTIPSTREVQHTLPCEIDLGAHHLLLKSDQSIELMRSEQERSEPEYVLCLDATETYRLMQCLCELFR